MDLASIAEILEMENAEIARVPEDALAESQLARRLRIVQCVASRAAGAAYDRLKSELDSSKCPWLLRRTHTGEILSSPAHR